MTKKAHTTLHSRLDREFEDSTASILEGTASSTDELELMITMPACTDENIRNTYTYILCGYVIILDIMYVCCKIFSGI